MPNHVRENIRRIANFRYKQMIDESPTGIYLAGFVLDPHELISISIHELSHNLLMYQATAVLPLFTIKRLIHSKSCL